MQNVRNLTEVKELGGKSTQRTALISDIVRKVEESVYNECMCNEYVMVNIEYKAGKIQVYMNRDGESFVDICHDRNSHESPMIAEAIEKALPDWRVIAEMAEIEENSEREHRNYLRTNSRLW